jgi:hypothetical protein
LSSHISHGSTIFLVVVKDFCLLFTKCDEDGGECVGKEFVDGAGKGHEYVVCDNYEIIIFMEYGNAMFPFPTYCFLEV